MKKEIGVPCPACGKRWQWDFCCDQYRDLEGQECESAADLRKEIPIEHFFCSCGNWLSSMNEHGDVWFTNSWEDINWDTPENYV